jgi:hypothetical protein
MVEQLDLFLAPPCRPTWERLPQPVQAKVIELIVKLLSEGHKRNVSRVRGKEAADE